MKKVICIFLVLILCVVCCGCGQEVSFTDTQKEYAESIYSFFMNHLTTTSVGFDDELYLNTIHLINENNNYYLSCFYSTKKFYKNDMLQQVTRSGPGVYLSYLFENGNISKSSEDYDVDKLYTDVRGIATWIYDYTKEEQINELYPIVSNF